MNNTFKIQIRPKSSILARYRDLSYKLEGAIAEFIDNSTDSFFKHKNELEQIGQKNCKVIIDIETDKITIVDNAFGMNLNDFKRSVVLDSPPDDTSGRSEKGMGLKTAATWLGDYWSVETSEYGSEKGFFAELNVNEIKRDAPEEIEASEFECNKDKHYTIITIKKLRKKIGGQAVNKLVNSLSRMYSLDIREKELVLIVNKTCLKYELPELWCNPETHEPYKKNFTIEFWYDNNMYSAYGWAGIREKGSIENEGFSIIRKGRALKIGYKPKKIFGGPNSYSQQRLIGEIHLDGWDVTHIKSDVQWEGGLEDKLLDEIKEQIKDIIKLAEERRVLKEYETPEAKNKMAKNNQDSFKKLKEIDTSESKKILQVPYHIEPTIEYNQGKKVDEDPIINISFKNITYSFEIVYQNNHTNDWITIEKTNIPDRYRLILFIELDYFKSYNDDRKKVEFLQKIAVTIATSLLLSKENGNQDFYVVLDALNTIVKITK